MKYETREKKDNTKREMSIENMFKLFHPINAKGRERFKDLKLFKKKYKNRR
jgi:hypothetical protein